MSKGSRLKHCRVEFHVADDAPEHDDRDDPMCSQCGFFPKLSSRDICDECAAMESPIHARQIG